MFARKHVTGAFAGEPEACRHLMFAAPNANRPHVVLALYHGRVPVAGFRVALAEGWNHDHHYLVASLGRKMLREMLKYGGTRPPHPDGRVTVWRGGVVPLAELRRGWSWTTDRSVACWFATQWGVAQARLAGGGLPLVIRASIRGSRIMHVDDKIGEKEVVLFGARRAEIDGALVEWVTVAKAKIEADRELMRLENE